MRKWILSVACLAIATVMLLPVAGEALMVKRYSFPDLVNTAAVIAEGTVAVNNDSIVLTVQEALKGACPDRLALVGRGLGDIPPASFVDGETVLVFLEAPDDKGVATLVGYENQGRLPKPKNCAGIQNTYMKADLATLGNAVKAVNDALTAKTSEERARSISAMIESNNDVMRLTGLELALSDAFMNTVAATHAAARRQIAAHALDSLGSGNPDIRRSAIRLVAYAPKSVVVPALLPLLADPEKPCRNGVKMALQIAFYEAKLAMPDQLNHLDTAEERSVGKAAAESLWATARDQVTTREAVKLRAALASASPFEQESAMLYLRYLGLPAN